MKKQSKVSVNNWIAFCFRGDGRNPTLNKQVKKGLHPKRSQIPSSLILDRGPWTNKEHMALFDLQVPNDLKEETYLAALLACWLYVFVFPIKDLGSIRPGTFKIASLMQAFIEGSMQSLTILYQTSLAMALLSIMFMHG